MNFKFHYINPSWGLSIRGRWVNSGPLVECVSNDWPTKTGTQIQAAQDNLRKEFRKKYNGIFLDNKGRRFR